MVLKQKMKVPEFIVVIPVVHSLEDLSRCLSSIDRLEYGRDKFCIVLVNCHIVDGLTQYLRDVLPQYGFQSIALSLPDTSIERPRWFSTARINEARNLATDKVEGMYYVFTEDDCTFEPDWLQKYERELSDETGVLGGPAILPGGMGWFSTAVYMVINSFLGTAQIRRRGNHGGGRFKLYKENMVIPSGVFERVGAFNENISLGSETDMVERIRDAGLRTRFLPDNHVWHRLVTDFRKFVLYTEYNAFEKVRLLRRMRKFSRSTHFIVLLAFVAVFLMGLLSLINGDVRLSIVIIFMVYSFLLFLTSISAALRTQRFFVGIGVLLLMPLYHFSIVSGIVKGSLAGVDLTEE
jgi:GT2 family glycosyltransferase